MHPWLVLRGQNLAQLAGVGAQAGTHHQDRQNEQAQAGQEGACQFRQAGSQGPDPCGAHQQGTEDSSHRPTDHHVGDRPAALLRRVDLSGREAGQLQGRAGCAHQGHGADKPGKIASQDRCGSQG